jgi:Uroporphyrinogen decarboxylase (URO-D)
MNSRERLLASIRRQPVDRVPISTYELVGHNPRSWENNEPSYKKLMDHIRQHTDCLFMTGSIHPEFLKGELIEEKWEEGDSTFTRIINRTPKGDLTALFRDDKNIMTRWTLEHYLKDVGDIEKYLSVAYQPPEPDFGYLFDQQQQLGDNGLLMYTISDPICEIAELFEFGQFMMSALTNEKEIIRLFDAVFERQYHQLQILLKHAPKPVLYRICGPEYATPPYLSHDYFVKFVKNYDTKLIELIHDHGSYARVHSHGCVATVLDDFVQMGADATDPFEAPPDGDIELIDAVEKYGDKMCLMGNLQLKFLEQETPEEIETRVTEMVQTGKRARGYVAMPTSAPINIPLNPRTEQNYLRFIDTALKHGK